MVLFRPYIKHISLREELALLEKSLDERQRVDIALTSERDTIVKKLEILINIISIVMSENHQKRNNKRKK